MEPMADASISVKDSLERGKLRDGLKTKGEKRKRETSEEEDKDRGTEGRGIIEGGGQKKKRKSRGPKEPNPLSVKKSKKGVAKGSGITSTLSGQELSKTTVQRAVASETPLDEVLQASSKSRRRKKHKSVHGATGTDDT